MFRQKKHASLLRRTNNFVRSNPDHIHARLTHIAILESVSLQEMAASVTRGLIATLDRASSMAAAFFPPGSDPSERGLRDTWKARDPPFLTSSNEHLEEHLRRLSWAYFRFSDPLVNSTGCTTPTGRALVRYGLPNSESRDLTRFGSAQALAGMSRTDLTATTGMEVWTYDTFSIRFRRKDDQWRYVHAKYPLIQPKRFGNPRTEEEIRHQGRLLDWDDLVATIPEQ